MSKRFVQIKDLKIGDQFFTIGLTPRGISVQCQCTLLEDNGDNTFIAKNDGIRILMDGNDYVDLQF